MKTQPRGFIALMSAIVISVVLLLIATGGSLSGFYTRVNALNSEYKERTRALAEACVSYTLLALANDSTYTGNATSTVSGTNKCYVGSITNNGTNYTFRTRAYLSNTYTSLSVVAKMTDLSVQSETEVNTF